MDLNKEDPSANRSSRRKPLVTRRVVEEKQVTYPNGEDEYPDSSSQNDSKASDGMDTKMYEGLEDYFRLFNDGDTSDSKNDSISENNLSPDKEENKRSKTPELEQLNVDEHGNVILPEGTEYVEPEEVHDSVPVIEGPEFRQTRATITHNKLDTRGSITCTACNKQINTNMANAAKRHPKLNVLLCQRCFRWYHNEGITQDADGSDEQCCWCGEGGSLVCCDFCNSSFCKSCIKRNLGRTELALIMDADENTKWHCYVCDPKPLAPLIADCDRVLEEVEQIARKAEEKRKKDLQKIKQRAERVKSPSNIPLVQHPSVIKSLSAVNSSNVPRQTARKSMGPTIANVGNNLLLNAPGLNKTGISAMRMPMQSNSLVNQKAQPVQLKPGIPLFVKEHPADQQLSKAFPVPKAVPVVTNKPSVTRPAGSSSENVLPQVLSQTRWTDNDVPITHQNVDIVLNATLSASQSMNNLLLALRDELKKVNLGKFTEHDKQLRREQVALKLRRSLLTFKHSFLEIERFAKNLQTNPAPLKSTLSQNNSSVLLPGQSQQVRAPPVVLRNSNASVKPNSALGQLLTHRSAAPQKAVRQPSIANTDNFLVVQQKGGTPLKTVTASAPVFTKPSQTAPISSSKVVEDVIELSDDDDDVSKNGTANGNCKNGMELISKGKHGLPVDVSEDHGGEEGDYAVSKKRKLEGLLTGSLTEQKVLSEIQEKVVQKSNGGSLTSEAIQKTNGSHGKIDNVNKASSENSINDTSLKKNTQQESVSADDSNITVAQLWDRMHAEGDIKTILSETSSKHQKSVKGDESFLLDDNSKSNGLPELHAELDEAPRLSPDSDVPVISPQPANCQSEELVLPQLDGLFDESDDKASVKLLRKRNRIVPLANSSSSGDDSDSSGRNVAKKTRYTAEIFGPKFGSLRDIEKERQLHLALLAEENSEKQDKKCLKFNSTESNGDKNDAKNFNIEDNIKSHKQSKTENISKKGASVEYDSNENSDTSNEVKNADDDMINSKNKNSKNKKLKLENKKKVKNISKSKPLSVSRNSADKQKVDSSSSNDSLSDASVDDGNDSDYAVKNLNKKNEGKEIKFLKEKLKKKDASDDILKEEDSMDKDIAKLAKMPSRHKKNHTHTKSENDSDSTECEDNPDDSKKSKKHITAAFAAEKEVSDNEDAVEQPAVTKEYFESSFPTNIENSLRVNIAKDTTEAESDDRAALLAAMSDTDENETVDSDVERILAKKEAKTSCNRSKDEEAQSNKSVEASCADENGDRALAMDDEDEDNCDNEDNDLDDLVKDDDKKSSKLRRSIRNCKLLKAPIYISTDDDNKKKNGGSDSENSDNERLAKLREKKTVAKSKKQEGDDSNYEDASKGEESSESDFETPKQKLKKRRCVKDSSDSSEKSEEEKGKKKKKKQLKKDSSASENDDEDEDSSEGKKKKKSRRRRIKVENSDSSAKSESEDNGSDNDDENETEDTPGKGRKKIRKIIKEKNLSKQAKDAAKAEEERRARIEERQKLYNSILNEEGVECLDSVSRLVLERDKDSKEVVIEVPNDILKNLKPHQIEAVQFMWNCCIETLEQLKTSSGSGCILAHCMGLGKTLSVISFIFTLMKYSKLTKVKRVLVICPLNTVLNWVNEWTVWVDEDVRPDVYELNSVKDNWARCDQLEEWHKKGGVMVMGYEMFRNLSQHSRVKKKKQKEIFTMALLDPGPDFVVCDEGHLLKNDSSKLSQAVNQIKTRRRIVLTGTPLQNNLIEYHCMVSLVKPNLLGTRKEFANRFVNPIINGQCRDSTQTDVKIMKKRAHILHETLSGCVQRKDYSALCKFLGPKLEYVLLIRLSKLQITLYEKYLDRASSSVRGNEEMLGRGGRLFNDYNSLMRICTHPWLLKMDEIRKENLKKYDSNDSFIDDSDEDSENMSYHDSSDDSGGKKKKKKKTNKKSSEEEELANSDNDDDDDENDKSENKGEVVRRWMTRSRRGAGEVGEASTIIIDEEKDEKLSTDWWAEYLSLEDHYKIELSGKMVVLAEVLQKCEEIGDKVLVFSQSLLALDLIEDFLEFMDSQRKSSDETDKLCQGSWVKNIDYFRMDGSTSGQLRKAWSAQMNDAENLRARLFLISTKAGCLGINLVGANRVVVFDVSWNPSHDSQSMFRVYRYGQIKPVYIYRFVSQGTMEEKIYERQVTKQSLSQRVIDEHQIDRHFSAADLQELYQFTPDRLDDPNRKEKATPILPKDLLLADLLSEKKEWLVSYHEHDSLLENKIDEGLTEEERKAAWEEYNMEKQGIRRELQMARNSNAASMNQALYTRHVQQIATNMAKQYMASNPGVSSDQVQAFVTNAIQKLDPNLVYSMMQSREQYMVGEGPSSGLLAQQNRDAYLWQQQQQMLQRQQLELNQLRLQQLQQQRRMQHLLQQQQPQNQVQQRDQQRQNEQLRQLQSALGSLSRNSSSSNITGNVSSSAGAAAMPSNLPIDLTDDSNSDPAYVQLLRHMLQQ